MKCGMRTAAAEIVYTSRDPDTRCPTLWHTYKASRTLVRLAHVASTPSEVLAVGRGNVRGGLRRTNTTRCK